ncbi:MAG: hypothetical protein H7061_05525 [Bdellovibrionaceae bacterium]|nr:hypothetical protein [Bdellovibrio sp.]
MLSKVKTFSLFALCFGLGISLFFSISEKFDIARDPASIDGKVFQISTLSSEQIKAQLSQKIKIRPTVDGKKSIQFSGFSSSLCKTYPEIEMEFEAEGVAVAGESPTMKITAPCEAGQDPAEMSAIFLPLEQILKEKPRNAQFKFEGYTTQLEFKNTSDDWPRQWILTRVQFKNGFGNNKSVYFERTLAAGKANERLVILNF